MNAELWNKISPLSNLDVQRIMVEKSYQYYCFERNEKLQAYTKQNGICKICGKHFELEEMEADHITPWSQGGKTNLENCQMLCKECNRRKSDK